MGRLAQKWMGVVIAGVAMSLSAAACGPTVDVGRRSGAILPTALPDSLACPHTWVNRADTLQLAIVGPATNIPEYHDCQRFIEADGRRYGPLAAIFRADSVLGQYFAPVSLTSGPLPLDPATGVLADSLGSPDPPTQLVPVIQPDTARAAAVILMIDGAYAPLRLEQGFNCLYLWGPLYDLNGTIVPVASESDCRRRLEDVPASQRHALQVNQSRIAGMEGFGREDVPPVARWDWTPEHRYFISISCGDYWCEVGPPGQGFQNKLPVRYGAAVAAKQNRRVVRINGWYDEQQLAAPMGPLAPAGPKGTVFPHPDLGNYTQADFASWQPVAFVALHSASPGYLQKFGWQDVAGNMAAPLPVTNMRTMFTTVSFCKGTRQSCEIPATLPVSVDCPATDTSWFARSVVPHQSLSPPQPFYKCVKYRAHVHGFDIPPVVRWRWRENDESLWVRCPQGCCEYDPT